MAREDSEVLSDYVAAKRIYLRCKEEVTARELLKKKVKEVSGLTVIDIVLNKHTSTPLTPEAFYEELSTMPSRQRIVISFDDLKLATKSKRVGGDRTIYQNVEAVKTAVSNLIKGKNVSVSIVHDNSRNVVIRRL